MSEGKFKRQAKRLWPRAAWIGRYASIAHCRNVTVSLFDDLAEAETAKSVIDETGCGGVCIGNHEIVDLNGE
jgi:tRNA-dihydrouridine synthase